MQRLSDIRPLVYYPATADYYRPEWAEGILDAVETLDFEDHRRMFTNEAFYAAMKAEDDRN